MSTIILEKPWMYRTPVKTISYPAGKHEVTQEIAERAESEGIITKESADGDTEQPATASKKGSAHKSKS